MPLPTARPRTLYVSMIFLAPFALIASAQPPSSSQPTTQPEKINIFEAKQNGYATYRIPGLVVTKSGALLAYCEARKNGTQDWDEIDVMLRRSTDAGRTWDEPRVIARTPKDAPPNPAPIAGKVPQTGKTTNNPVAIADPESGVVHFLYCVNYQQCFYHAQRRRRQNLLRACRDHGRFR